MMRGEAIFLYACGAGLAASVVASLFAKGNRFLNLCLAGLLPPVVVLATGMLQCATTAQNTDGMLELGIIMFVSPAGAAVASWAVTIPLLLVRGRRRAIFSALASLWTANVAAYAFSAWHAFDSMTPYTDRVREYAKNLSLLGIIPMGLFPVIGIALYPLGGLIAHLAGERAKEERSVLWLPPLLKRTKTEIAIVWLAPALAGIIPLSSVIQWGSHHYTTAATAVAGLVVMPVAIGLSAVLAGGVLWSMRQRPATQRARLAFFSVVGGVATATLVCCLQIQASIRLGSAESDARRARIANIRRDVIGILREAKSHGPANATEMRPYLAERIAEAKVRANCPERSFMWELIHLYETVGSGADEDLLPLLDAATRVCVTSMGVDGVVRGVLPNLAVPSRGHSWVPFDTLMNMVFDAPGGVDAIVREVADRGEVQPSLRNVTVLFRRLGPKGVELVDCAYGRSRGSGEVTCRVEDLSAEETLRLLDSGDWWVRYYAMLSLQDQPLRVTEEMAAKLASEPFPYTLGIARGLRAELEKRR